MVHVTGNFLTEAPLKPLVIQALLAAQEDGWADPKKIHNASARSMRLLESAKESIGSKLSISPANLEFIGEPKLGFHLAISGLMHSAEKLLYSSIDRQVVHAIGRAFPSQVMKVDNKGYIELPPNLKETHNENLVLHIQSANIETGILQNLDLDSSALLAIDATASGTSIALPERWDTALFDSRSWGGPSGLGVLAIRNTKRWKNPLPHISTARTPHSYFLPLAIASAVALENFDENNVAVERFALKIKNSFPESFIGAQSLKLSHLISLIFPNHVSEELLRLMEKDGFLVDAGSACTSADLSASHVLDAMNISAHGHIRITIRPEHTESEIDGLIASLKRHTL